MKRTMYAEGVSFKLTSPMGKRINPITNAEEIHKGIDTVCKDNRTLYAPENGTITLASTGLQGGRQIHLTLDDGRTIRIMHLASFAVSKGQRVSEGDVLGIEGKSGYATGVHCHIEIWEGKPNKSSLLDIASYLGIPNEVGTYVSEISYRDKVKEQCGFDDSPTMELLDSHPYPDALYEALWNCLYNKQKRIK